MLIERRNFRKKFLKLASLVWFSSSQACADLYCIFSLDLQEIGDVVLMLINHISCLQIAASHQESLVFKKK